GRFAISNHIPPTLKPTKHFKGTKREVFGHLMQCQTGHGYIGKYFSKFVPTKNIDCPCGKELQTCKHILRSCPRYKNSCDILQKVSLDICLADILGTEEGIEALVEFLSETGTFTRTGSPRKPIEEPVYKA
ncbi:hypothetical protein BT96DRAFT_808762, partial [Gymnopus androsaceus JB14]